MVSMLDPPVYLSKILCNEGVKYYIGIRFENLTEKTTFSYCDFKVLEKKKSCQLYEVCYYNNIKK